MDPKYNSIIAQIDELHARDPNKIIVESQEAPYELHYSRKMTFYLEKRDPSASEVLRIAVRAQHLCRWEVPRDSYPMTKAGYLYGPLNMPDNICEHSAWRTFLKKRQAELASHVCEANELSDEDTKRVAHLIRKEDLSSDPETQVLEDVACLVFLDDQFAEFEKQHDEEKIINIIKKTWRKMSGAGRTLALEVPMSGRCKHLVSQAITQ